MPQVGFEPTVSVLMNSKSVFVLLTLAKYKINNARFVRLECVQ